MASQEVSQSSSSSGSSSLELQQHQPSLNQQRASSGSGSFGDQPGPSGLQPGPSGLQAGPSGLQAGPSGLQVGIPFPSQEIDDFESMMMRDEGATTYRYSAGRRDEGAHSGHLSDDNRVAEVPRGPHTETSSHTEVSSDDNAVVPSPPPNSQQSQSKVVQQESERILFTDSSLSDISQTSLRVPSLNDSPSTTSDHDQAVPKKKVKKKAVPKNVGVNFSPSLCSSSSSSCSSSGISDGSQSQYQQSHGSLGDTTSDSSVDPPSTTSAGESGSSGSQSGDTPSSGQHGLLSERLLLQTTTSQSLSTLNFSQPQGDYHIPATPDPMELPSVSSDVISSTPDADMDGSSQELISSTPEVQVARYKRDRSYDGDDDASSLDEAAPKRRKLSPLVTSASTSTTSATPSPRTNEFEFKTPLLPTLKKSKSGSSSGGSSGGSMNSTVTSSSSGSTTPYPSSSSGGAGQLSSSLSSSDVDIVQVETTPIPAVQTMPQLETSKEDLKDVSTSSTIELIDASQSSQSMDATVSLDMIGETVPQSFPADDSEFNLHLSNATTATECSAVSQDLEESQVESQPAATISSSSSSSEQTVEDTPTPDDHVTSPSQSPDDNDDSAAGGRGSDPREPEDNEDEMEGNDKNQDSKNEDEKSGRNGEQQEENEENSCSIVEVVQPLPTEAAQQDEVITSSVDMAVLGDDNQQEHVEENSCIIVESLLSPEPAHQVEDATPSEFEFGMTAPSTAHQITLDSPIKVPKVTEDFSQDTFSPLNIQAPDTSNGMPPIYPISSVRPHSSLLETVRVAANTESANNTDPFEFDSEDEAGFDRKKKAPKPPPKITATLIRHHDDEKVTDDNNNETVTELLDNQSDKQLTVGKKSPVTDNHSPVVDDEHSLVIDEQLPVTDQPPVAIPVADEHSPVCVGDMQSPISVNQALIVKQLPVTDKQLPIAEELPTIDQQSPVADEHSPVHVGDIQSPISVNQAPIVKQLPVAEELSTTDQQLPVGDKQSSVAHLHQPPHDSDIDEMEYLALEMDHSGEITPSEHGQIVDRSSEDPLNSATSRSEMASTTESSPRTFSEVSHSQERHSRTTIYTTKTVIVKKKFIEEQMVNDQWVTTDEYQEELDPVVEEREEMIMKCVKSYPPKTIPFQDTSISSSFTTSSTPKTPQRTPVRRTHNTSNNRSQRTKSSDSTPSSSQAGPSRTEDDSPTVTQEESSSSRIGQLTPQLEVLQCADNRVLARWKDGQWYPGTIQDLNNGKYVILFDDGDKKVLAKSSVVQMSLLKVGSEVMVLTEDDDYLRGSITGRCTVDDEPGYLVNTGGREPLRCPESDLKLTQMLVKQLTSTGPSPAASPAVRSKRRTPLFTTPLSSKKRRTSSSPTVSTSGGSSSMLFCELSFLITGEGKTSQSLGDQIIASGGVVLSEFPTDVCPSKTFLLADKPRRTAKYLLALAGGVPCVRPSWAKDCLKQNRLLNYDQYLLPAGQCSKTNKMIPWSPREPKTILARIKILLKGNSSFKKFWEPIIMATGGRLVSRLSYSNKPGDDCDLVLCEEGISGETLRRAQNLQLPCIDVEWAIQCLITGEQLDHSSYACT